MASTLKINTLTGVTTAGSIAVTGEGNSTTTNLQQGLCKSWIYFDSSIATIVDSFNIGSITDNGTGDFMVDINNPMGNITWCPVGSCGPQIGTSNNIGLSFQHENTPKTTTRMRPVTRKRDDNQDQDVDHCYVQVVGDLA